MLENERRENCYITVSQNEKKSEMSHELAALSKQFEDVESANCQLEEEVSCLNIELQNIKEYLMSCFCTSKKKKPSSSRRWAAKRSSSTIAVCI